MGTWQEESRRKMHEILDAVLDANGFEERKRSKTGALPTVFMNLSGHIAAMDLHVNEGGWDAENATKPDREFCIYFDREIPDEQLSEVKEYLVSVSNGIDARRILEANIERAEKELADEMEGIGEKRENIRKMRERLASLEGDDNAKTD